MYSVTRHSLASHPARSSLRNAGNSDPGFTWNTPLLICSMRIAIPYPCIGCSSSVFKISMSSVPCTNPLALSVINIRAPLDNPEEDPTPTLDCQEELLFLECGGLAAAFTPSTRGTT